MRIDAHIHHISSGYRAALDQEEFGYALPPWSRDAMLSFMDRFRIDAAVTSPSPPGVYFGDARRARDLARLCNEETAALVRSAPDRFAGLAILPLPDVEAAIAELANALDELHLDGVILFSNVDGIYPGDQRWDDLFAELDRRGAYVFLHPDAPATALPLPQVPVWLQEFPFETTRAVTNLIYSGTLERHPRIRLQLAHLGGTVPFLGRRIASLADREPEMGAEAPAGAHAYLERLYYDTGLSDDRTAFDATRSIAGLDRIVYGSDWPFLALPAGDDPAPGLSSLPAAERLLLDAANAAALVPRLVRT
jgi:predicted TIM-barrel fold metal-dependent hydrolase